MWAFKLWWVILRDLMRFESYLVFTKAILVSEHSVQRPILEIDNMAKLALPVEVFFCIFAHHQLLWNFAQKLHCQGKMILVPASNKSTMSKGRCQSIFYVSCETSRGICSLDWRLYWVSEMCFATFFEYPDYTLCSVYYLNMSLYLDREDQTIEKGERAK